MTPLLFIALSGWIAYAQVKEHFQESMVVVGVLAFGGILYWLFDRSGSSPAPPRVPEARVVDLHGRDP